MNYTVKQKIFNDPVYGFISIPYESAFDVIEHRYFQRLRRITQLGLTGLVYSGANHTRFQHALGAMHLMVRAIETLRIKGHNISEEEAEGAVLAILMHDIGHGPYSHSLEFSLVNGVSHEHLSQMFMHEINCAFEGKLDTALSIFNNNYSKPYLHRLVSGQLDVDRLDYLKRDSFFTGVSEGVIGSERIIKMLNIADGDLVVEAKGIYSIEKFLIARRLMYWQVYLHKTVLAAENILIRILRRAKELSRSGNDLFASPSLQLFLKNKITLDDFRSEPKLLNEFAQLDDHDIMGAVKVWINHADPVLSQLSLMLVQRRLPRVELRRSPVPTEELEELRAKAAQKNNWNKEDAAYFVFSDKVENRAYTPDNDKINILGKNGDITDVSNEADLMKAEVLSSSVKKYFICYPKNI